jgi:formylglycine-generating enzyme required for sulfatase activity
MQAGNRTRLLLAGGILIILVASGYLLFSRINSILPSLAGRIPTTIQIRIIRWLARNDNVVELAAILDQCTVSIPAGDFIMGSDGGPQDKRPQHSVYLDAYQIDRYEVTNAQYARFLLETGQKPPRYWAEGKYPTEQSGMPVVGVSWSQAQAYCQWIGKRLPTEAEWEKACRGTEGQLYPWGDTWDASLANVGYAHLSGWPAMLDEGWAILQTPLPHPALPGLEPVGAYPVGSSPYGVFDLAGNASEWVADWYNWADYSGLPAENPIGTGPPWNHSVRGSAWFDRRGQQELVADLSRCARRNSSHSYDDPRIGFRCAK